jgi:hypothetical protein
MSEHKEEEEVDNYSAGKKVSVDELMKMDAEDESLRKYKESLLGAASKNVYSRKITAFTLWRFFQFLQRRMIPDGLS